MKNSTASSEEAEHSEMEFEQGEDSNLMKEVVVQRKKKEKEQWYSKSRAEVDKRLAHAVAAAVEVPDRELAVMRGIH